MAIRGEILASRRSFGFGRGDTLEHFLVVQSGGFEEAFGTVIVAPVRKPLPVLQRWPGAVSIKLHDGPSARDMLVLVPLIAAVPTDRFEPSAAGRADRATMTAVERVLRALFDLR